MGRRSKADIFDLTERILRLHSEEKLTIEQIAERLQNDGYAISREAVRRSLKSSKEIAADIRKCNEEARVIMDTVRDNPDTDLIEAVMARLSSMLYTEMSAVDSLEFDNPKDLVDAMAKISNAKVKASKLRLDYTRGADAAKKAVIESLKKELKEHPDLLERLTLIVSGLTVEA